MRQLLLAILVLCPLAARAEDADRLLRTALIESVQLAGVGVSPAGDKVAFYAERADVVQNGYRADWYVLDLRKKRAQPQRVASGGDMPWTGLEKPTSNTGRQVPRAQWSRDGKSFAYLKRQNGATQVWLATPGGKGDRRISDAPADVTEVRWTPDGARLLTLLASEDRGAFRRLHDEEARDGVLFDPGAVLAVQQFAFVRHAGCGTGPNLVDRCANRRSPPGIGGGDRLVRQRRPQDDDQQQRQQHRQHGRSAALPEFRRAMEGRRGTARDASVARPASCRRDVAVRSGA